MKTQKILILFSLTMLFASSIFAQKYMTLEQLRNMNKKAKAEKKAKKEMPKEMKAPVRRGMSVTLKQAETLAEGSNSSMTKPFIYVARTKEDYSIIKNMVEGYSSDKQIDFNKQAVIAAFAGTKNSGGYSIQIYDLQGRTNVLVKSPPKGTMTTMALTSPYKIAVVNVEEEMSLNMAVSDDFKSEMTTYEVTSSEFEFEGGFVGMQTKFKAEGTVSVMKYGDSRTYIFNLKGIGKHKARLLNEISSGQSKESNSIISRVEAGDFINRPHPPLKVAVDFTNNNLLMEFKPGKRNYVVNDGFVARGSLEAILKQ